ncbi:MAG: hypothetical protein WAT66_14660 [Actinomycetota bacterium]
MIEAPEQHYIAPQYSPPTPTPGWFARHKLLVVLGSVVAGVTVVVGSMFFVGSAIMAAESDGSDVIGDSIERTMDDTLDQLAPPTPTSPPMSSALEAPPPAVTITPNPDAALRAWAVANSPTVDAIMGDLDDLEHAADQESVSGVIDACTSFRRHVIQLQAHPAPSGELNAQLSQALRYYRSGAEACIALDLDRSLDYFERAGTYMTAATNLMVEYS